MFTGRAVSTNVALSSRVFKKLFASQIKHIKSFSL